MKTITILCDSRGAFRCAAVPSPEAFRRAVSAEAGCAHILFVATPVLGLPAGPLIAELEDRVLRRFTAAPGLVHDPRFLLAVTWCLVGRPIARRILCRLASRARRVTGIRAARRHWARIAERHSLKAGG